MKEIEMADKEKPKTPPVDAAASAAPELNNPDFQVALKSLLAAYQPILEEQLNLVKNPQDLQKQVQTGQPTAAEEFAEAHALFEKFLTEDVAQRLLPAQAKELLGPVEQWRWCYEHIICCLVFGWLVCRWPRTFRGYAYYLYEFWKCVRQVIGEPVSNPPTEEEGRDFDTLVKILAEAFKPYLTDQLASVEYPGRVPEEVISGEINSFTDNKDACVIFERLMTTEAARALLGAAAFKKQSEQAFFWFCRCWCLCALCFGCCLARARNIQQVVGCLYQYYLCLRDCFRPLTCDLTPLQGCVSEQPNMALSTIGVAIDGTAAGLGFSHYILEWWQPLSPWSATNFDYPPIPPGGGTQGNLPVVAGELAFLDTASMNEGLTSIRMTVYATDGTSQLCGSFDFYLFKQDVLIDGVDNYFALNTNPYDPAAEFIETVPALCARPSSVSEVSFGGSLSVEGGAWVGGCVGKQIASYSLDYQPGFVTSPTTGVWTNFWNVVYNPADPYEINNMNQRRDDSELISYWGPYQACFFCPVDPVGKLYPTYWPSTISPPCGLSGLYTLRLTVVDTAANLYYDTQRIWIDNKPTCAAICIPAIPKCADLLVSSFANPPDCSNPWCLPVMGIAYDEPIDESKPLTRPNLNFDYYYVHLEKQGGPEISLPIVNNPIPCVIPGPPFNPCYYGITPVGDPGTRCVPPAPVCPSPPNPLNPATFGLLTQFDLRAVDPTCSQLPSFPYAVPIDFTIDRGTCCVYNFKLWVYDRTITTGGPHWAYADWPIKICNDLK
jgi:hypothetical protein